MEQLKLNPSYRLVIDTDLGKSLVITNPITIDFKITRSIYAGTNSMEIDIYNLKPERRNLLFQDVFDVRFYKKISLEAGYGELSLVFLGNVYSCYTTRKGNDIVTHIQALDGGLDISNSTISETIEAGSSVHELISRASATMYNLGEGSQNIPDHKFTRPVVLEGNSWGIIQKYTNNTAFVDLQEINIMQPNDVKDGWVPIINDQSGLLKVPQRRQASLTVEMIFEPRMVVGQVLQIDSSVAPEFNGQYKVIGMTHQGMISDAVSGTRTTTLELWVGGQIFGRFNKVAAQQRQITS